MRITDRTEYKGYVPHDVEMMPLTKIWAKKGKESRRQKKYTDCLISHSCNSKNIKLTNQVIKEHR